MITVHQKDYYISDFSSLTLQLPTLIGQTEAEERPEYLVPTYRKRDILKEQRRTKEKGKKERESKLLHIPSRLN
jgi:hypothetical protein